MRTETFGCVTMILADNMEVMKGYKDKQWDLACVDPPYGIGEDGASNHSRGKLATAKKYTPNNWDKEPPSREYFNELFRVGKNQIVFGANHFISRMPYDSSNWIVWDKNNGNNDFADCELAWTSFNTAVRKFKFTWAGMLQEDMKNKQKRIHPTEKPIALYSWIFSNYAKPGQTILDTHCGSGSSAIAALKAGLTFTGIEIDEEYFNDSCERIQAYYEAMTIGYAKTKLSKHNPTLF